MNKTNRSERIALLQKVASKHFTAVLPPEERSVLDTLMYACCLEDAPYDQADEAFARLQEAYFDWNEIRVTTITELSETLHNLPNPRSAAIRVKKNLQSLFETRYSFDLEDLRKMNLGKAQAELENLAGMTRFVLGYVVQHALGGHAIPVSESIMALLEMLGVVSQAEAAKGQTPGLERAMPKSKGIEFASQLHQFAVAVATKPGSPKVKGMLKEAGYEFKQESKPRKSKSTKVASPASEKAKRPVGKKAAASGAKQASAKKSAVKETGKKSATSKSATKKSATQKSAKKSPAKKTATKKAATKKAGAKKTKKAVKSSSNGRAANKRSKRKPR